MNTQILAKSKDAQPSVSTHFYAKPINTKPNIFPRENFQRDIKEIKENVITLGNLTWERFEAIENGFDGIRSIRLTYLDGALEIMAPISSQHEDVKCTFNSLLEIYMREKDIRFYGRGSVTLQKEGYSSGEPDVLQH